jgi:hypothetical protein
VRLALLLTVALLPACGPSLTTVHEGTIRFEHCYRLDLEAVANRDQQRACWSLWLDSYTYGQSRDRIEYARRRLTDIADQNGQHPELRLAGEQRTEQRQFYLVVPAPSSVHATPPPILAPYEPAPSADDSDAGTGAPQNAKAPPAEGCAASCKSAWQSCETLCSADADAGAKPAKPASGAKPAKPASSCDCKESYGKCMRGCFK